MFLCFEVFAVQEHLLQQKLMLKKKKAKQKLWIASLAINIRILSSMLNTS